MKKRRFTSSFFAIFHIKSKNHTIDVAKLPSYAKCIEIKKSLDILQAIWMAHSYERSVIYHIKISERHTRTELGPFARKSPFCKSTEQKICKKD